ncbi:MAG: glycerol-3-phosphate 1-O-acyltransferase PlsY [Thermovirgaceae bacterium]
MSVFWLLVIAGYLFGSIPAGYLAVMWKKGIDIRIVGSGNIGATNVGRILGRKWSIAVAAFDMVKGGVVLIAGMAAGLTDPLILGLSGFAAVIGHDYPFWLRFRGGKGISTTYGAVFVLNPIAALGAGAVWYAILRLSGYVSVASIVSLWFIPVFMIFLAEPFAYVVSCVALAALAVLRHSENIRKIREGTEAKVGR